MNMANSLEKGQSTYYYLVSRRRDKLLKMKKANAKLRNDFSNKVRNT